MRGYKIIGSPGVGVIVLAAAFAIFAAGICVGAFLLAPILRTEAQNTTGTNDSAAQNTGAVPFDNDFPGSDASEQQTSPDGISPSAAYEESDGADIHLQARQILSRMSLSEKVCQVFIVFPDVLTGVDGTKVAGERTKAAIEKYPVGGLILMSQNITGGEQIAKFNETVQTYSKIPLFLAVDEEGGQVARLGKALGAHSIGPMFSYKNAGADTAFENAVTLAKVLKEYGFNLDFAPVADVKSNPENTVIGNRAYSDDFEAASELVSAAVQGFSSENIICVLKHFPGHGDTAEDSHYSAAYARKSLGELLKSEFLPFTAGIDAGADMVMLGHIIIPDVDEAPASISYEVATVLLREQLGYSGVIITDALNMRALTDHYSTEEIAVAAVNAGADILLGPAELEKSVAAVIEAVRSGAITEDRLDESVGRILELKIAKGMITP